MPGLGPPEGGRWHEAAGAKDRRASAKGFRRASAKGFPSVFAIEPTPPPHRIVTDAEGEYQEHIIFSQNSSGFLGMLVQTPASVHPVVPSSHYDLRSVSRTSGTLESLPLPERSESSGW